ncbi:hypothetical protein PIB30_033770 [Stylosanthes scabra]|uniref:Uncharacterized protein n=1 Tax=Stylosanthes scabra TaxID=79078 RepID=A0ABU6TCC1_9FABA|nr:hypothetical protein [Stylosanthes scabra]
MGEGGMLNAVLNGKQDLWLRSKRLYTSSILPLEIEAGLSIDPAVEKLGHGLRFSLCLVRPSLVTGMPAVGEGTAAQNDGGQVAPAYRPAPFPFIPIRPRAYFRLRVWNLQARL